MDSVSPPPAPADVKMGQEIELKMSIDEMDVDRLIRHPFIARHAEGPAVKKHLTNHYFDTPEQILGRHAMAFRIRYDGSSYIQTLKRKGEGRDGLTIRGEWEWVVGGPDIEPHRVPSDIWPPVLKNRLEGLIPIFRTDFQRTVWVLKFHSETRPGLQNPARVEISLDQGVVTADTVNGAADAILEVEFELLEGETDTLFEISRRLRDEIRLTPCNLSKAERGYRLLSSD